MPEEYFIVEPRASEWVYVIQKLIKETPDLVPDDVVLSLEMPFPVYYLRREKFSVDRLAAAIGAKPRATAAAKVIRLQPFEVSGKLPNPTVPYFGEA